MACICDECDDEIFLDEAEEVDERILCPDCLVDEKEKKAHPGPRKQCTKCWKNTLMSELSEKLEGQQLCPRCAHAYELELWTPPDHSAAECPLCTAH